MSSKELAQNILAKIQAAKLASNTSATPTAVHSNKSLLATPEQSSTLRLHIAAYYIMRRDCTSRNYVAMQKLLANSTYVEGFGSTRNVSSRLLGLVMFGIETNIELWEVVQNIFYSFTLAEQKQIVDIIFTNYGEITYN